jgi:hypothetical protein
MKTNKNIKLIKHLIKGRIDDMEKRMDAITNYSDISKNVQIEYEQNYLGRKAAYEDVLCLINDYLETPIQ